MPVKRIHLAGAYNTRNAEVTQLSSASGVVGVGIVGSMIVGNADVSSDKDQRFINCFTISVANEMLGHKTLYLVKRPGFVVSNTPAAGEIGSAIHVWSGQGAGTKVITAFGSTNSTIYDGTGSLGAITGKARSITETRLSSTAYLTIASSDSTGWYYTTGGGLVKIADGDYPGNAGKVTVGNFAHMDGYAFIMDVDGNIWNSDLNSVTSWTASGYIPANAYPDKGVGIVRHRNHIVALKKESFEVFENVGNPTGSPLSRVTGNAQLIGCISSDAVTSIKDSVFFAGSTKQGVIAIYQYDGGIPKNITTPEIQTQLTIAGPANVSMTSMGFYGRHFIIIQASNTTFVYCVEEQNWHEWNSTVPLWYKADGVNDGATIVCYSISNTSTDGEVYVFNPASASYQDAGVAFTASFKIGPVDMGTRNRKFWNSICPISNQENATSNLLLSWSDDDFQNFQAARTLDLQEDSPTTFRCGSSRRRIFAGSHSSNTPMRIQALEIDYTVGTG